MGLDAMLHSDVLELIVAYAILLLWLAPAPAPHAATRPERRWPTARAALAAALIVIALSDAGYWLKCRYFNADLQVTFVSVGQGDCAVVRFPGSKVMLIDGGGSLSDSFDPGERLVAPLLWSQKIMRVDYLVLSHPELDHFGGFRFIAQNFHPREFWTIAAPSTDIEYEQLLVILAGERVRLSLMDALAAPMVIGGVRIACLNPAAKISESRNNSSMVLALTYGAGSILFTGDLEARGERQMLARGSVGRATVLKVPHHGSRTSSTPELLAAVAPAYAVISVGHLNAFHFPAPEVLARYRDCGARILRTDEVGAVNVKINATSLTVTTPGHI